MPVEETPPYGNSRLPDARLTNIQEIALMASVNLNLSEELQQFVDDQVEVGKFDGADAYVEALIARAKKGQEKLEALLIEGLDSGKPIPLDAAEWSRIRGEVKRRLSNGS